MKFYLPLLIIFTLLSIRVSASVSPYFDYSQITDTIPPPPPDEPDMLTGPSSACVGETSQYNTEVPVGCICQWYVNGILQSETSPVFSITWATQGIQIISQAFLCNGVLSDPESISVAVAGDPQPGPIEGETLVCADTYHTYATEVGPLDSCQWTVNGEIQPGFEPFITYSFNAEGEYLFEVIAFNNCGTSSPQTLLVTAQGSAPGTPSPIQGPDESCTAETDIFTTTVNQEESCEWRIDGILQASTTETLEVTWTEYANHIIEVRAVSECGTGNPATKNVEVYPVPEVFLGNDTTLIQNNTIVLDAGNPGSDYLWSTGAVSQTINVNSTGTYWVEVSNFCGQDSDTIVVTVLVGIEEHENTEDCPVTGVANKTIRFLEFPCGNGQLEVYELTGKMLYQGPEISEFNVPSPGIYLIRFVHRDSISSRKILVK